MAAFQMKTGAPEQGIHLFTTFPSRPVKLYPSVDGRRSWVTSLCRRNSVDDPHGNHNHCGEFGARGGVPKGR